MEEVKDTANEETAQEILERGEVSLWLNSYNDIFSSFDPRPFSHRALSIDFLDEAKRATREIEPGKVELRFLLPASQRRIDKELMIKKRLKEHFKKHFDILGAESRRVKTRGILLSVIGFLMMISATYIIHYLPKMFLYDILYVLFEPGGWFTLWTGLDTLFFGSSEHKRDLEFYKKMVNVEVIFSHY
jgi:hypothetical protein